MNRNNSVTEKRVNIKRRIKFDEDIAVADYVGGMSEFAVANKFDISRSVLTRVLNERGVERRNMKAAQAVRYSQTCPDARRAMTWAANIAARGRGHSLEEKAKRARTVMARKLHTSEAEFHLQAMLSARGIGSVMQEAIGPYNCDLGAFPVAVEVFGGGWHWHGRHLLRTSERFRYILNAGWHVLVIKTSKRIPLTETAADYITAFIQEARSNPAARREYRVIRGAGEVLAAGSADDDEITIIPTLTRGRNARGQYAAVPR